MKAQSSVEPSTETNSPASPDKPVWLLYDQLIVRYPVLAGIHPRTLKRWESDGKFPHRTMLSPQTAAWDVRAVDAWNEDPKEWMERAA